MKEEPSGALLDRKPLRDDRMVFLLPADRQEDHAINVRYLWHILWQGRLWIASITSTFAILAVVYALTAQQWYRAEVVLIPAKNNQGLASQIRLSGLSGLASIAGVDIADKDDNSGALAVLRSHDFMRAFIEDRNLLPVLFADRWDGSRGRWKAADPHDQPDVRDAVKYFEDVIYNVIEDKRTGLVSLTVEWKDADVAAEWANALVLRVNERLRQRALEEAERNIKFLNDQLSSTSILTLQQSISRLIENELQTLMLARGNQEFAFRVIDRASIPKWRSRPKRTLLVAAAVIGGGIVSVIVVLVLSSFREDVPVRSTPTPT